MTAKASEKTVLSARRIVSLLIAATVAVFLFFVIAEAGHDCSGDHCCGDALWPLAFARVGVAGGGAPRRKSDPGDGQGAPGRLSFGG